MIEIIAMTVEDAIAIERCGADRIELISAFAEGGLTPSYGMIKQVCRSVDIPVNVMIRPHSREFNYTEHDIEVMINDIHAAKELGANGVVFGVIDENRQVNEEYLERLLNAAQGMDVTFHKAIDETDVVASMKVLAKYKGITSVLTSGGYGNPLRNMERLQAMEAVSGHINLLIGGGLTLENIKEVDRSLETSHFHFGTAVRKERNRSGAIDVYVLTQLVNKMK